MTLGDRIRLKRNELGLSVDDIAKQLGISRATVYRYESSFIENMGVDKLAPLAEILKTTPFYLLGLDYNDSAMPFNRGRMIPVLGRIKSDLPVLMEENVEDYHYADVYDNDVYFYLRVRDESMIGADIHSGALVLIRQQNYASSGQIIACTVDGGDASLKRYNQQDDTIVLMSENPAYELVIIPASESEKKRARILGVAVEVRNKL